MARTKFELIYPHDNSRKQIGCSERNSLLLRNEIKQIGPTSYKFIGQAVKTFSTFVSLAEWQRVRQMRLQTVSDAEQTHLRDLLLIWLFEQQRDWQFEQYPSAMEEQLDAMGFQPKPAD